MSDETSLPLEDGDYTKLGEDDIHDSPSIHSIVNKLARKRCLPDDNSSQGCDNITLQCIDYSDFERKLSLEAETNIKLENTYAEEDVEVSTPSRNSSPTGVDCIRDDEVLNPQTFNADNVLENTSKRKSSRPCKYEAPAKKMSATISTGSSLGRETDTYTECFNYGDPQTCMNNRKYMGYSHNGYLSDRTCYNDDTDELLMPRSIHVNSGQLASRMKLKRAKSTIKGPVSCIVRKLLAEMANSVASVVDIECNIYKRAGRRPKLWTSSVANFSSQDIELLTSVNINETSNCLGSMSEYSKQFKTYEPSEVVYDPFAKIDFSSPFCPQKRRRGRPSRKDKMEEIFVGELWQVMDSLINQVCIEIDGADLSYQNEIAPNTIVNSGSYFAMNGTNECLNQMFVPNVQTTRGRGFRARRSRCRARLSNGTGPRMPISSLPSKRSISGEDRPTVIGNLFDSAQFNILNALLPLMQITNGQIDTNVLRHIIGDGLANLNGRTSVEQPPTNNTVDPLRVDQMAYQQSIPDALNSVALKFQNTIATAAIIAASQAAASLARASDSCLSQPVAGQSGHGDFFQQNISQAYLNQCGLNTALNSFLPQSLESFTSCNNRSPSSNTGTNLDDLPIHQNQQLSLEDISSHANKADESSVTSPLNLSNIADVPFVDSFGALQSPNFFDHRDNCRGKRRGRSRFTHSLTHEEVNGRNNLFNAIQRMQVDTVDTPFSQRGVHTPRRRNAVGRPLGSRKSRIPRRANDLGQ